MAKQAAPAKTAAVVVKKKQWVPIVAPALFNNVLVGETYVEVPQSAVGTTLDVSVMVLTGEPQKQNVSVTLKITGLQQNQLVTEIAGYRLSTAAGRKMMRRNREKIEDSFLVQTKDGKVARIKPVLVTRNKTQGGVLADLRRQSRIFVAKRASELTFAELVKELVTHKFQRDLSGALKKTYPVQFCDVRKLYFDTAKPGAVIQVPQGAPAQKPGSPPEGKQEAAPEEPAQEPAEAKDAGTEETPAEGPGTA